MAPPSETCPDCGTPNLRSYVVCYYCGHRLPWAGNGIPDDLPDYTYSALEESRATAAVPLFVGIAGGLAFCLMVPLLIGGLLYLFGWIFLFIFVLLLMLLWPLLFLLGGGVPLLLYQLGATWTERMWTKLTSSEYNE